MQGLLVFTCSAICAAVLILALSPIANRVGLVDKPGGRKTHKNITPTHGGISIFFATFLTFFLFAEITETIVSLFIASAIIVVVGVIDDLREMGAKKRILLQIAASLAVIYLTDIKIDSLGSFFGSPTIELGIFSTPFTVFCFVCGVNAINMADGIDGLAGGEALIACLALSYLFSQTGDHTITLITLTLAGSLIGFLSFNYRTKNQRKAKVFMGDAGSTFLGFALVWLIINYTQQTTSSSPSLALWILAIPLIDSGTVILQRIKKGISPMAAGRDHLHHIFLDHNFNVQQTCFSIHCCNLLATTVAITLASYLPHANSLLLMLFAASLYGYYLFSHRLSPSGLAISETNKSNPPLRLAASNKLENKKAA